MPRQPKPKPFDVPLSDDAKTQLGSDLCRDIQHALDARQSVIGPDGAIDLLDWYYEQGQSSPRDRPFPGAADLTSSFITEKVSALRARLLKAIFGVKPFCFVEGWGPDAQKAPYVEAFHDWQVRKGGLKAELGKTIHGALIEDGYILEVSERIETRRIVEELDAQLDLNELGAPQFDAENQPKIKRDAQGEPVPAGDGEPSAKIKRDYVKTKRLGPQYDAISLKDFVFLPGHAKNQTQVYGYAYRLWARVPELQERAEDGVYDADAVEKVGEMRDRESGEFPVTVDTVAAQEGPAIEIELFQVSLKRDLDGDGREEWYLLTVHLPTQTILRCKLDTFVMKVGIPRCVPFMLFPRRNSVYGYSYAGNQLLTLAEEHTSLRNMKADRSALATNAPMTVLQGALWDPEAQPIGVGRTITVREHNEVKPLVIPDVPQSIVLQENQLVQAAERVSGLSDSAVGVLSQETRTLGEQRLVAGGSAVRVDEVMGYLHAAIADVMKLSNAIWVETLEQDGKGLDAPLSVMSTMAARGQELQDGKFTASMLRGDFMFEPYGSDATADPERRRSNFTNGFMALANLAKVIPAFQAIFQNPSVAKATLEEFMRVYDWRDPQSMLTALQAPPPGILPTTATPSGGPAPMGGPAPGALPPGPPQGLPPALMALLAQAPPGGVPGVQ